MKDPMKAAILAALEEADLEGVEVIDLIDELGKPAKDELYAIGDYHEPCQDGEYDGPVDWNNGRAVEHVAPFHTRNKRDVYRQNNTMQVSGKKWKR